MASIDTGSDDRNKQLQAPDFFDTARHPEMRFESRQVRKVGDQWQAVGTLTLHGVKREITLPFTIQGRFEGPHADPRLGIHTAIVLDRTEWDMGWENNKQVSVIGKKVTVDISLVAKLVAPSSSKKAKR